MELSIVKNQKNVKTVEEQILNKMRVFRRNKGLCSRWIFKMNDYYVYVYIDPRNYEEFYYGKGKGTRKLIHLTETDDSKEKVQIIASIRKEGLEPVIKVIASGLTDEEASLIETTLIWKLGKYTTNIAAGHFSKNFRPHNTYHQELPRFDFQNELFFYNVGEKPADTRNWDDYIKYGFISAGQGKKYSEQISKFNPNDIIVAYMAKKGYVGVGKILSQAQPVEQVYIGDKKLLTLELVSKNMGKNSDNPEKSEYVCKVDWIKKFSRYEAKYKRKSGLYTPTFIKARLNNQKTTIEFIEKEFDVNFKELLK